MDCLGCGAPGPPPGGGGILDTSCDGGICADDTTWVSSFFSHCADYSPTGSSNGYCTTDPGVGGDGVQQLATEACPVTCGTCPPTFDERQNAVNLECCDEKAENCGPDRLPVSCNQGCATRFLSFWNECQTSLLVRLQHGISQFDGIVAMCQATA
jgi:hypothetical protein